MVRVSNSSSHFILFEQRRIILLHIFQHMIENSFTKPPGTVGDLVFLQIKMDQAVFLIAEHECGLFRARLYLALRFVLLCSHQITIEISAS